MDHRWRASEEEQEDDKTSIVHRQGKRFRKSTLHPPGGGLYIIGPITSFYRQGGAHRQKCPAGRATQLSQTKGENNNSCVCAKGYYQDSAGAKSVNPMLHTVL